MLSQNLSRYYFFSISNLIAAFGGGLILGKGTGIIDFPYLQGGSILAFFIGTILGLVFLQSIPERLSKLLAQSFSISCGITSLILFYIYHNYSYNEHLSGASALIFFLLLSIRFGFWFYSRVMRASKAAEHQHSIAWVEFGYYMGMVLGLIIWKLLGINLGLGTALIIDASFQFMAGILDLKNFTLDTVAHNKSNSEIKINSESQSDQYSSQWCWKLAGAVVFITIGVQVVIFNTAHYVADAFGSYILATFYFGVAAAAFMCNKYKAYISWNHENRLATINTNNTQKPHEFNFLFLILISALAVIVVISQIYMNKLIIDNMFFNGLFICTFVFIAAFIYEVISISLLDRVGYEEKKLNGSGMIMRTYGLMGLGAAIGFWTLGLMDDHLTSSMITLGVCLSFATIAVTKRSCIELNVNQLKVEANI